MFDGVLTLRRAARDQFVALPRQLVGCVTANVKFMLCLISSFTLSARHDFSPFRRAFAASQSSTLAMAIKNL